MSKNSGWLAPLCGPLFLIAVIAVIVVSGDVPDTSASPAEVVSFYSDNETSMLIVVTIMCLAALLLLCFASYLQRVLQGDGDGGDVLPRVAFAGAVLAAGGVLLDGILTVTLVNAGEDNLDPAAVQALNTLWNNDFVAMLAGLLIMVFAAGLSAVRNRSLPRVLAWTGVVLGVTAITPVAPIAGLPTVLLWIPATGIVLARRVRLQREAGVVLGEHGHPGLGGRHVAEL